VGKKTNVPYARHKRRTDSKRERDLSGRDLSLRKTPIWESKGRACFRYRAESDFDKKGTRFGSGEEAKTMGRTGGERISLSLKKKPEPKGGIGGSVLFHWRGRRDASGSSALGTFISVCPPAYGERG